MLSQAPGLSEQASMGAAAPVRAAEGKGAEVWTVEVTPLQWGRGSVEPPGKASWRRWLPPPQSGFQWGRGIQSSGGRAQFAAGPFLTTKCFNGGRGSSPEGAGRGGIAPARRARISCFNGAAAPVEPAGRGRHLRARGEGTYFLLQWGRGSVEPRKVRRSESSPRWISCFNGAARSQSDAAEGR